MISSKDPTLQRINKLRERCVSGLLDTVLGIVEDLSDDNIPSKDRWASERSQRFNSHILLLDRIRSRYLRRETVSTDYII